MKHRPQTHTQIAHKHTYTFTDGRLRHLNIDENTHIPGAKIVFFWMGAPATINIFAFLGTPGALNIVKYDTFGTPGALSQETHTHIGPGGVLAIKNGLFCRPGRFSH